MAEALFYGNTSENPERFLGLSPRFNTLDQKKAPSAVNVIDAGGTGSKLTSIWLIAWGNQTVFGIYPKGDKAGFEHKDLGEVTLQDERGAQYQGYRTHYKWAIGLVVKDWRYVVRIANVDLATITDDKLIELMIQASELLPDQRLGRPVFYMNRRVRTKLRTAMLNKHNVQLTPETVAGKKVTSFDEIPVKRCDALKLEEAKVA
jgi:hypothetical protein